MCHRATSSMKTNKCYGRSHIATSAVGRSIQRIIGRIKNLMEVLVCEIPTEIDTSHSFAKSLANGLTGDFSLFTSSHTIADHEESLIFRCLICIWETTVFLMVALTLLAK